MSKQKRAAKAVLSSEPIHLWFGLSHSNYLVLPRSVLQSMPAKWQREFVALLTEARELYGDANELTYRVNAVDEHGRFVGDPLADYERGRRRVEPVEKGAGHS